jgi:ferritin-like metal-binding protein YciE
MRSPTLSSRLGNLSVTERWLSLLVGLGLTTAALRRGGLARRGALSTAGLALLARGVSGYCGVKARMAGEAPLGAALREQWQRLRAQFGFGAGGISSVQQLYTEELQELYSTEGQLDALLLDLVRVIEHAQFEHTVAAYGAEVRARHRELGRLLGARGIDPSAHPDQAMPALMSETRKMAQVRGARVRDTALLASLQRLIHYRIAAYASVAGFARALDRVEEAVRLAEYAERDRAIDADLTELARVLLDAHAARRGRAVSEARSSS